MVSCYTTSKFMGFDKPKWMAKSAAALSGTAQAAVGSEFRYNARRSRIMQLEFTEATSTAPTKYNRKRLYAMGSTLEVNYTTATPALNPTWTLDTVRIYVPGPEGVIGAREFRPASGGSEKALVYHYDHLGSITAITDYGSTATTYSTDSGTKPGKFSEDAWGQRRNPFTWTGPPETTGANKSDDGGADSLTPRGFTGHEMLDDLGLVHMNGRIYDPLLGRFLSADVVVQTPGDLQSFNRYSYVKSRPLSATDPSGFFFEPLPDGTTREEFEELKRLERNTQLFLDELLGRSKKTPAENRLKGNSVTSAGSGDEIDAPNSSAGAAGAGTAGVAGTDEIKIAALARYRELPPDMRKLIRDSFLDPATKMYAVRKTANGDVASEYQLAVGRYQKGSGEVYYQATTLSGDEHSTDANFAMIRVEYPEGKRSLTNILSFHSHSDDRDPGLTGLDKSGYNRGAVYPGGGASFTVPLDYSGAFYGRDQVFFGWSRAGEFTLTFDEMRDALK